MKRILVLIIMTFGMLFSCQNNTEQMEKKETLSESKIQFKDDNGNVITKEELAESTGTYNYEIYKIDHVPDIAITLHAEARQYGQKGDYETAINKLVQARKEAPNWPYPPYDLAYTYLLQDDFDNALKYYTLTDAIAPNGFYTSKTALNTLQREESGEFPKGLYKSYLMLEWMDSESEKNESIKLLVEKLPTFAPAWNEYSDLLEGKERLDAIEQGLLQNPDIETKGALLINKALVINENGDYIGAEKLLIDVIFDTNSTYGNVEFAKFMLENISN